MRISLAGVPSRLGPAGRNPSATSDQGSALIEVVVLGLLVLLPLAYVVLAVFEVQRAAYATTTAAREAGRALVTAPSQAAAVPRARAAAAVALADQGLSDGREQVRVECPVTCLRPGEAVTVEVSTRVALPFVPDVFGRNLAAVAVSASHEAVVDRFREVPG
jgi:hypothetical protein